MQNTQKITKAMQVVAATKLRRAQQAVQATRPYSEKMLEVLATTAERATEYQHPFLVRREGRRAVVILVTPDKGLAGAISSSTIRAAVRHVQSQHLDARFVTIGRKGNQFLTRFRRPVIAEAAGLGDRPPISAILPAVAVALDEYQRGEADQVLLVFPRWVSTMRQEPEVRTLVPVEIPVREAGRAAPADYIYEPGPEEVLDALLPRYVETQTYQAVLETQASFYSAQMIAMQNATKAAGDFIKALTLTANKVRQSSITTELMEIVSGAEALRSSSL